MRYPPSGFALLALMGCGADRNDPGPQAQTPTEQITNRIQLSAEMMGNLGITFYTVERGNLQMILEVPGQLVVPDDREWVIRTPSSGRLALAVSRWTSVEAGDVVAELTTPA